MKVDSARLDWIPSTRAYGGSASGTALTIIVGPLVSSRRKRSGDELAGTDAHAPDPLRAGRDGRPRCPRTSPTGFSPAGKGGDCSGDIDPSYGVSPRSKTEAAGRFAKNGSGRYPPGPVAQGTLDQTPGAASRVRSGGTWPLNALDQGGSRPGHGRPAVDEPLVNPAGWPQSRCGLVFTYPRKTAARRTETRSVHRGR